MSRFSNFDHLSIYIQQIDALVSSVLIDQTTMKSISSSTDFVSCPVRFMEEVGWPHPIHSMVVNVLNNFHEQYGGCSSKTLLFFLIQFYRLLQPFHERRNFQFQQKIIQSLEDLIEQSRFIAERDFSSAVSTIDENFFRRISRDQSMYADCLHQIHLQSKSFDQLHHFTRVKHSEECCRFYPGFIIPTTVPIDGSRRTVLIDGYLLEDYRHLGYNSQLSIRLNAQGSSAWLSVILSIIRQFNIEILLCTETVDVRIKDHQSSSFHCYERVSIKILRSINEDAILSYLTDLNDENQILNLHYQSINDDHSLMMIDGGATILHDVPLESLVKLKNDQFEHCLGRCREILRTKRFLDGSGRFETRLIDYWNRQTSFDSTEKRIAMEIFLQALNSFVEQISRRTDLFRSTMIDDCSSKFDAWRRSLDLVKIFMQIDDVISIVSNDDYSDL